MVNVPGGRERLVTAPRSGDSRLFAPDDLVVPGHPIPVFGDHRWDLSILGLAANRVAGDAVLNFDRFLQPLPLKGSHEGSQQTRLSPIWLLRAKEVIAILLTPARRTSRGHIDAYRVHASTWSSVRPALTSVYVLAAWATQEGLPPDLRDWRQDDLDDFLVHLAIERRNRRSGAHGLDSVSIRGYVNTLRTLHLLHDTLTDGGFDFNPWDGLSAEEVTGSDIGVTRTRPIPAEQYQPLMRNLWKVIEGIGPDLLDALRCADELDNRRILRLWGNVNQYVRSDGTGAAELVLCTGNLAPTLQAFHQMLIDNPDTHFASGADFERRTGIPAEWFSRNRAHLIAMGIMDQADSLPRTPTSCTIPSAGRRYRWTGRFPEVRTVAGHLATWLEDPANRIPLRASDQFALHLKSRRGGSWSGDIVNRDLLARMIGLRPDTLRKGAFKVDSIIDDAVARGQTVVGGLGQISSIRWADGSRRPWIDGIDPALLEPLRHFCRMCCIVFIYMFSGMRDSEVQSLKRGCVEPFWGHLTLTGKEFKTFRGAQARWVVIEPVARAARLAESLTWHDKRIVVSARPGRDPVIDAGQEIDRIIATMNAAADLGLLEHIPSGAPIRPHRFRRTFAITARKYPWMQIALNWQFKHASHFMTQSYYALNDDVTADSNDVGKELVEAAVDRLAELYGRHERGEQLYGKAAGQLLSELGAVAADVATIENGRQSGGFVGQVWRHAEVRKRLRGSALRLYPGLALDCAFGPGGACGGVEAPNWNACNPQCRNAILDATQLTFLKDTADRIRSYLDDRHTGATLRLVLQDQLDALTTAIADLESRPEPGGHPAQS